MQMCVMLYLLHIPPAAYTVIGKIATWGNGEMGNIEQYNNYYFA